MPTNRAFFLKGFILFALMTLLSLFGFEWAPKSDLFSPVAPAAGLALAGLFLGGINLWPWIFLSGIASRLITYPASLQPFILFIVTMNTAAYVAGAMYLSHQRTHRDLSTLLDMRRFITAAALIGAIASLAPLLLLLFRIDGQMTPAGTPQDLVDVFFGRFTGVLLITPLVLTLIPRRVTSNPSSTVWGRTISLVVTAVVTLLVFGPFNSGEPIGWILFPPLVFCALVGGTSLTAKALVLVAVAALCGTTNGYGPFIEVANQFAMVQQFLAVISITSLILAAVSTERRVQQAIQQRSEDLRLLSDAAFELLSTSALVPALDKILPGLAARCNVDIVTYHVVSHDQSEPPRLVAQYGIDNTSPTLSALTDVEACMSRSLGEKSDLVPIKHVTSHRLKEDKPQSTHACFCVPVRESGKLIGMLCVASRTRQEIDRGESQLVETVANSIATAARRLRQENDLRQNEARFRELANAVPNIVWVSRADGTPEFFNKRWYEFTGEIDSGEPHLVSFVDLCDPAHREEIARRWSECVRSGEPFEMEHQLTYQSGDFRWVLTRAAPTRDATGAIVRWFGTCTDLHDKKVLEAERDSLLHSERLARMEAERASRIKDDFLATVSHELRNPLNAIIGWAHLLCGGKVDTRKAAGIIEQSGRLQAQLIDDLLDMSRIVSGKLSLRHAVVNVSEVVSTTCESMQLVARDKGVSLETQLTSNLEIPHADVSRITQIVSNLLTNAIKFTPRGGCVTVTLVKEGDEAVLSVHDTGAGISPDFLPHLFDRFRQADPSAARRYGGLGIGLAIAKHLTVLHGGHITATSPGLGQGATFTVRLPLKSRADEASIGSGAEHTRAVEEPTNRLVGAKLVVVEDDPPTLEFLSRFLSERGATVVSCESGQAALNHVRSERPDMVISDIGMPDMDGYQVARKIREIYRDDGHLPLLAVTAFARAEDAAKATQAGFDAHLPKPLDMARLEQVITGLLESNTPRAA